MAKYSLPLSWNRERTKMFWLYIMLSLYCQNNFCDAKSAMLFFLTITVYRLSYSYSFRWCVIIDSIHAPCASGVRTSMGNSHKIYIHSCFHSFPTSRAFIFPSMGDSWVSDLHKSYDGTACIANSLGHLLFLLFAQIERTKIATDRHSQSLTYWGRVTHICVNKLIIIGSDNGLSPGRHQAIIWTNAGNC